MRVRSHQSRVLVRADQARNNHRNASTDGRDYIFLATGALTPDKVISRHYSIIWFLGWRCLYAETVSSRIENRTIDLESALKRAVSMLIGRLKAYGVKWADWVRASRLRTNPNGIGRKHRNKKLLFQEEDGSYSIHDAIMDMADTLGLKH